MKKLLLVCSLLLVWGDCPTTQADGLPPLPGMTTSYRNHARNVVLVFVDGLGKRYHRANCRLLGENSYSMSKKAAAYNGYSPCPECW